MTLIRSNRLPLFVLCLLLLAGWQLPAQETTQPEAATPLEQVTAAENTQKPAPKQEIPDISGRWQTGESKRSVQAMISKTETPGKFTAFISTPRPGPFLRHPAPGNDDDDKPLNFSRNLQLTWNPATSQFISEEKLNTFTLTPTNDRNRLKVEFTPDEQAYNELKEEERNLLKTTNDLVFNPIWIRSYAIFNGFDSIESKNLIVVSSKEGLSAYNKSQGEWANLDVDVTKCSTEPFSRSSISDSFFSIVIEDRIYGYSSDAGRWDSLPIPADQRNKTVPSHGLSSLSVRIGDKLYAMSPTTGKWTSPNDSQAESIANAQAPAESNSEPKTQQSAADIPNITGYWQREGATEHREVYEIGRIANSTQFVINVYQRSSDDDSPKLVCPSLFVWNPEKAQFIDKQTFPNGQIAISLDKSGRKLKVNLTPINDATLVILDRKHKDYGKAFLNSTWVRSTSIFGAGDRIEGKNIIVVSSVDGLSAHNKFSGKTTPFHIDVTSLSFNAARSALITDSFFSILADDKCYGYSNEAGTWAVLEIPANHKNNIERKQGDSTLRIRIGDETFALSPKSGQWTDLKSQTLDDIYNEQPRSSPAVAKEAAEQNLVANLNRPGTVDLKNQISATDLSAAAQADRIRGSIKEKGFTLDDSRTRPETQDTWIELEKTLGEAFDAKTALERTRIQELRRRLDQSEALIEKRLSQKEKIVKRRARELVEGEETQWTTDDIPLVEPHSGELNKTDEKVETTGEWKDPIASFLQIRLEPLTKAQKATLNNTNYRSGLRVAEMLPTSPMRQQGVKQGDLLVGLAEWETTNLENVRWILKRVQQDLSISGSPPRIRFYIVSDGETKMGQVQLTVATDQHRAYSSSNLKLKEVPNGSDGQSEREAATPLEQQVAMLLGLRLAPLTDSDKTQLKKTRYGGGLRIVERLAGFSSNDQSVAAGDILVALDKWEITSLENVIWTVDQIERDFVNSQAGTDAQILDIKILIVRNGALRISHAIINPLKKAGTATSLAAEPETPTATQHKNDDADWSVLDRVATIGQELITAKREQIYTAKLYAKNIVSKDELDIRDLRLTTARRRFDNLTEECNSKIAATESDLEVAGHDIKLFQESVAHAQSMHSNARGTYASVLEEKRKLTHAETLPPKFEARLKRLHRAAEELKKIKTEAKLDDATP